MFTFGHTKGCNVNDTHLNALVKLRVVFMHSQKRLGEEYERSEHYLDRMTRRPLIQTVEHELLENQISAVLDKGFNTLMDAYRVSDLGRLYNLCGKNLHQPNWHHEHLQC